jgi:hypothetical protein
MILGGAAILHGAAILGGAALQRCDQLLALRAGFSR